MQDRQLKAVFNFAIERGELKLLAKKDIDLKRDLVTIHDYKNEDRILEIHPVQKIFLLSSWPHISLLSYSSYYQR